MNYEHRGHSITLNPTTGTFAAVIGGKRQTTPSLASMKAKIDKALDDGFKPFKAVYCSWTELGEGTVVGIEQRRGRWKRAEWQLDNGRTEQRVCEDTPEARAAIKKWADYVKETRRIRREREAETDRLHGLIPFKPLD